MTLTWHAHGMEAALARALRTLGDAYPLAETQGDATLEFVAATGAACVAEKTPTGFRIAGGTLAGRLRAVGSILSGLVKEGAPCAESCPFGKLGIMLDCSRNAVMKPEHVTLWLRRMALLGYNRLMLYTEDTYEIPGEKRFGFNRGGYTQAELKELDRYAASLGIEMVGCIQTLAHLEQLFRWPEYGELQDFDSTIFVGNPKAYELIGKMLDSVSDCFATRQIHIGMDEAWHLGRGKYLDANGWRRRFDIFNEHLAKVVALCKERGLSPMIWSDMYFAMREGANGYYDRNGDIPADVVAAIPKEVNLVYWDYYHADPKFYRDWIAKHRAMGFEPKMASGVWTWSRFWHDRHTTEANAGACIEACRAEKLDDVFFTLWGDDGAYCDFDSAWAGMTWAADKCYADGGRTSPCAVPLASRFRAICGGDYEAVSCASDVNRANAPALLWDDPIYGMYANEGTLPNDLPRWGDVIASLEKVATALAAFPPQNPNAGDLEFAALLAETLAKKLRTRQRLEMAYDERDPSKLAAVARDALDVAERLGRLETVWRRGWMLRNRPHGWELIEGRLAILASRHRELARRIDEYLSGDVPSIPELDDRLDAGKGCYGGFRHLSSGSLI
ncbi:MAG: beta-N-acetylhexosaminidase [Kiritimatiellaeota bacterium]|nr:beta-N-acetylhexosaminidase [Kiritimatiellota bacterium]